MKPFSNSSNRAQKAGKQRPRLGAGKAPPRAPAALSTDAAVEALLGRPSVQLDDGPIRASIEGQVVMVTGAAGSIGSELCRQLARFHPAGVVGFDIAESPLAALEREMRARFPATPFFAELGSIQNRPRVRELLRRHAPAAIYHAAAYKHVPMLEAHVFEAIENNVFGAYTMAQAAVEHGAGKFVLISSDKAARPASVMGATKRLAELLLLALSSRRTKFMAVRFGNVLGSNGSVLHIFREQIAAGGPVTVTHPEMRRYFMTIPEACRLVLAAAAIGKGGQLLVLDLGEPVKIVDLACSLIRLSGLIPDKDIRIEFTAPRPGEKLREEGSAVLAGTAPTAHKQIRIYKGKEACCPGDLAAWLERLQRIASERDLGRLVAALKKAIPDYTPSAYLVERVRSSRNPSALPSHRQGIL